MQMIARKSNTIFHIKDKYESIKSNELILNKFKNGLKKIKMMKNFEIE